MIASEPQISEGGFGFTCSPNIVSSDFENGYVRHAKTRPDSTLATIFSVSHSRIFQEYSWRCVYAGKQLALPLMVVFWAIVLRSIRTDRHYSDSSAGHVGLL